MKMNSLSYALFLTAYVVFSCAKGDVCRHKVENVCFKPGREPIGFPRTLGAFQKICPRITEVVRCLLEYKNFCGKESPKLLDFKLDEAYALVVDACDKKSELHLELSSALPCLEKVFMTHKNICHPVVEVATTKNLKQLGINADDPYYVVREGDHNKYVCLAEALDASCFVARASVTCGDAVASMLTQILDRVEYMDAVCGEDTYGELQHTIAAAHKKMQRDIADRYSTTRPKPLPRFALWSDLQ